MQQSDSCSVDRQSQLIALPAQLFAMANGWSISKVAQRGLIAGSQFKWQSCNRPLTLSLRAWEYWPEDPGWVEIEVQPKLIIRKACSVSRDGTVCLIEPDVEKGEVLVEGCMIVRPGKVKPGVGKAEAYRQRKAAEFNASLPVLSFK